MEIVGLIFNVENARMLALMAFGYCGYAMLKSQIKDSEHRQEQGQSAIKAQIKDSEHRQEQWQSAIKAQIKDSEHRQEQWQSAIKAQIKDLETSLLKTIDEKISSANQSLYAQLKANDFKHLNDTIEALTFMLEKNKFLSREDKEYIDGRLDK